MVEIIVEVVDKHSGLYKKVYLKPSSILDVLDESGYSFSCIVVTSEATYECKAPYGWVVGRLKGLREKGEA